MQSTQYHTPYSSPPSAHPPVQPLAVPAVLQPSALGITTGTPTAPTPGAVALLRGLEPFAHLPEPLLGLLAARAQFRRYERDEHVITQDTVDGNLFVLHQGRAHLERQGANGRTVLLDVLEPGALMGEYGLIDGAPHDAGVRCVQACEVLVLRGAEVLHCQAQSYAFSDAWARTLVQRLRGTNRRIASMSLDGVRERVMWRLAQWSQPRSDGLRIVSSRVGRNELARMVGASREMVCRVLRSLHSEGRIELQRDRSILLIDPAAH